MKPSAVEIDGGFEEIAMVWTLLRIFFSKFFTWESKKRKKERKERNREKERKAIFLSLEAPHEKETEIFLIEHFSLYHVRKISFKIPKLREKSRSFNTFKQIYPNGFPGKFPQFLKSFNPFKSPRLIPK